MAITQVLKKWIFPSTPVAKTIPLGLYRGIQFEINFAHKTQLFLGLWEKETHAWIKKLCRGIATAIDVGAATGEQTLYFLKKTSAQKVFALEPEQPSVMELQKNLALNQLEHPQKLNLIHKFCGTQNDSQNISLDSLSPQISEPGFVKIDIEGAEVLALQGATQLLQKKDVRWLIESHSPENEVACLNIFKAAGYQTQVIKNGWWRIFIPEKRPIGFNRWLIAYKKS